MVDMNEDEIVTAFLRRIQLQALYHRIGDSVDRHVVMRFREAGTWDKDISQPVPPILLPVLRDPDHPQRMLLPAGPLVVVTEDQRAGIIEVAEQFLSHNIEIRRAALQHFLIGNTDVESWVSPYVLSLLQQHADAVSNPDESKWISAGLSLRDAIRRDFRINCAGVRQTSLHGFDDVYQEYFERVIFPKAQSFEHDRPPILEPSKETEHIRAKIQEWARLDDLGTALDKYLSFCGYLPLKDDLSAASLVSAWEELHPGSDVWNTLWQWSKSCSSLLARFHVAQALLSRPGWILPDEIGWLLSSVRNSINILEAGGGSEQAPRWQLRAALLQHYQMHLEASDPGLNGDAVATTACWIAEMTAQLFECNLDHVPENCEFLQSEILPRSRRRWSIARSRMTPTRLRNSNLNTPFLWKDSLLATAVKCFNHLPVSEGHEDFRRFLASRLTPAMCVGGLRVVQTSPSLYLFDEPLSPSDLGLPNTPTDDGVYEAARQVLAARLVIESSGSLKQHLIELQESPEIISELVCISLRAWLIDYTEADEVLREMLSDVEWRQTVFHRLPLTCLDKLISFFIDWQMQQADEWLVRVPQIFAIECENAVDADRRELLLSGTTVSTLASDVASPFIRLLSGPIRRELSTRLDDWRRTTRLIARESEPWVAGRVRGFLGTIEGSL